MIIDDIYDYITKVDGRFSKDFCNIVMNSTVLKAQNVANYMMQENDKEGFYSEDFPNIAPPWNNYFIHWTMPKWTYSKKFGKVDLSDSAPNIEFCPLMISEKRNFGWLNSLSLFLLVDKKINYFGLQLVPINKDGCLNLEMAGGNNKFKIIMPQDIIQFYSKDLLTSLHSQSSNISLMATCFCHCKNVDVVTNNIDHALIKRRARDNKIPIQKFYTLNISGNANHSDESSGIGSDKAFHICRGHFKNFTSEKPLLGKHVGTYWWAMHTKGSKQAGEVTKQYQV